MIDGFMTTNFALSLSFDGIRLLQRVADGWYLVGDVVLDSADLKGDLADLREKALSLDPSGLRCKILIPEEQIKYITLETAQTDINDVMEVLEGATPYAIKDLVIDFDCNGGRTFIAAVARETLEEAEAFAKDHKFNPVSFAAIPAPITFKSEVFFGPTKMASSIVGGPIVRDEKSIVVTGVVSVPEPDPIEDEEPPVFTPRPRMATPESVAEPASPEAEQPPKSDDLKQPLAVPVGNTEGPTLGAVQKIATPTIGAAKIKTAAPKPSVAPAVTGEPEKSATAPAISAPLADDMAAKGGFSSRRTSPVADARPSDAKPAPKTPEETQSAEIATKQAQAKRGKPRFLGLILTAILLAVMAAVAIWASTLTQEQVSSWFGYDAGSIIETVEAAPPETAAPATQVVAAAPQATDAEVTAATETAPLPQVRADETGQVLSPAEADLIYTATGVWQRAPRFAIEPREETFSGALPALDPTFSTSSHPVMPDLNGMSPDLALLSPVNPPAAGTTYARNADGFILATPEGTQTPTGAMVFAGKPPKEPPARPAAAGSVAITPPVSSDVPEGVVLIAGRPSKVPPLRPANAAIPETAAPADEAADDPALAGSRPAVRPEDLAPAEEAIAFAADPALAGFRPRVRPAGLAPPQAPEEPEPVAPPTPDITDVVAAIAEAAPASPYVTPTARAVKASRRPDPRPRNFSRVVARATQAAAQQDARAAAAAPAATSVSNATAQPSGAVPGGVARAATLEGAIRLRDVNLIGVYGQPNNRRALVRLGNGRYVKVEIGSSLDGGQVTAIGDNALNYVKRGKTYALQLPSG